MLLPAEAPLRRADTIEVIATALLAHHGGDGHRLIAKDLGVPHDTVRSWLRRIRSRAEWLRREATQWAHSLDPCLPPRTPAGTELSEALEALGAAGAAQRRRLGVAASPWQVLATIAGGRLVAPLPVEARSG